MHYELQSTETKYVNAHCYWIYTYAPQLWQKCICYTMQMLWLHWWRFTYLMMLNNQSSPIGHTLAFFLINSVLFDYWEECVLWTIVYRSLKKTRQTAMLIKLQMFSKMWSLASQSSAETNTDTCSLTNNIFYIETSFFHSMIHAHVLSQFPCGYLIIPLNISWSQTANGKSFVNKAIHFKSTEKHQWKHF